MMKKNSQRNCFQESVFVLLEVKNELELEFYSLFFSDYIINWLSIELEIQKCVCKSGLIVAYLINLFSKDRLKQKLNSIFFFPSMYTLNLERDLQVVKYKNLLKNILEYL